MDGKFLENILRDEDTTIDEFAIIYSFSVASKEGECMV
jgi:hypothetical protein